MIPIIFFAEILSSGEGFSSMISFNPNVGASVTTLKRLNPLGRVSISASLESQQPFGNLALSSPHDISEMPSKISQTRLYGVFSASDTGASISSTMHHDIKSQRIPTGFESQVMFKTSSLDSILTFPAIIIFHRRHNRNSIYYVIAFVPVKAPLRRCRGGNRRLRSGFYRRLRRRVFGRRRWRGRGR
jgi:hypothetical protein